MAKEPCTLRIFYEAEKAHQQQAPGAHQVRSNCLAFFSKRPKLRAAKNSSFLTLHSRQLGIDRVVDLQFGDGEAAHHLILEM